MRNQLVVGNWKMFTTAVTARALASAVKTGVEKLGTDRGVGVAVCPPFPYLMLVREVVSGSPVALGAQNAFSEPEGAFTGEVSPVMLADVGCRYVILGHSERRHKLGEDNALINRKVHASLAAGLQVILCVGETLAERQADHTDAVLRAQLSGSLAGLGPGPLGQLVLAYEPVWAIGTGQNATPEQAQQAHAFIRGWVREAFSAQFGDEVGEKTADTLPLLYGGSAKPENVISLFAQPDVDGGLIGGASLNADQFLAIIRAARPSGA
jgi:triosephosphate isomerase